MTHSHAMRALAAILFPLAASAQGAVDPALMATGEAIYLQQCQICHRDQGQGLPPGLPAIKENENLGDLYIIVKNLHEGQGTMPPFPTLTTADIVAVATYVRNSFGNAYGAAAPEEVTATLAELMPLEETRTIWDGVYSEAQAARGKTVYKGPCGLCHGTRLNGAPDDNDMRPAPPLARANFLRVWEGRSLGALYAYTKTTMPQANPGFLPDEDYAAIVAHMLSVTGAPPGESELPADVRALGHILITPDPNG
jgi:mono/diheme cytochrome c family protein